MRLSGTPLSLLIASPMLAAVHAQATTWTLVGNPVGAYRLVSAAGLPTDRTGATIALKAESPAAAGFGSITAVLPADTFRMRRVKLSADIDTRAATAGASPWLRIDGTAPSAVLAFDNAQDRAIKGTASGHIDVTLFVPSAAKSLVFGLLLSGGGEATARNLRIEALPQPATLRTSAAAQTLLDTAIALVTKSIALARHGDMVDAAS